MNQTILRSALFRYLKEIIFYIVALYFTVVEIRNALLCFMLILNVDHEEIL